MRKAISQYKVQVHFRKLSCCYNILSFLHFLCSITLKVSFKENCWRAFANWLDLLSCYGRKGTKHVCFVPLTALQNVFQKIIAPLPKFLLHACWWILFKSSNTCILSGYVYSKSSRKYFCFSCFANTFCEKLWHHQSYCFIKAE